MGLDARFHYSHIKKLILSTCQLLYMIATRSCRSRHRTFLFADMFWGNKLQYYKNVKFSPTAFKTNYYG